MARYFIDIFYTISLIMWNYLYIERIWLRFSAFNTFHVKPSIEATIIFVCFIKIKLERFEQAPSFLSMSKVVSCFGCMATMLLKNQ